MKNNTDDFHFLRISGNTYTKFHDDQINGTELIPVDHEIVDQTKPCRPVSTSCSSHLTECIHAI